MSISYMYGGEFYVTEALRQPPLGVSYMYGVEFRTYILLQARSDMA